MNVQTAYSIFPLGDSALIVDFGNQIMESINRKVIGRFRQLRDNPVPYMIEAIPAYSSLAIYYDTVAIRKNIPGISSAFEWMKNKLEETFTEPVDERPDNSNLLRMPVCYDHEFAPDLAVIAESKNMSAEEIVQIHTSVIYRVYMLGFLPGFAYMGETDERITAPRKSSPVRVEAGSVGIAGRQTGVYPLHSPGGWQIIGKTPLVLFDVNREPPVLLQAGDQVQFYSIGKDEFKSY
jgi:inhibitor of KinA